MSTLDGFIAECLGEQMPPHGAVQALRALWEAHRGLHPCRDENGHSGLYGGPDRPTCASLLLVASAWEDAPVAGHPPVRTFSDVERLGELGLKADAIAYGAVTVTDEKRTRNALEAWAAAEGVPLRWV